MAKTPSIQESSLTVSVCNTFTLTKAVRVWKFNYIIWTSINKYVDLIHITFSKMNFHHNKESAHSNASSNNYAITYRDFMPIK